jgi:hypothetical protein
VALMDIHEALEDVEIAFRQLEFTIKLLTYCELGNIQPAEFDTDHLVLVEGGNLSFPSGRFSTPDDLNRAAGVSVLVAFSASVLVLDKAFEVAGVPPNPDASDPLGQIRILVYMLRCAHAHSLADPRWKVRGKYARVLKVDLDGIPLVLDLKALQGAQFVFDQIGGYMNWYRIHNLAVRALRLARQPN